MKFQSLIATMENQDAATLISPLEQAELDTRLTESFIDIDNQSTSIDDHNSAIKDAYRTVDSLDEIKSVIESGTDEISVLQTVTVETLHNSILLTLGYTSETSTLESFSGMDKATLIATLEEKSQGILSKIWTSVKALFTNIIGFIKRILTHLGLLGNQLDSLEKEVKANPEAFKEGSNVSMESLTGTHGVDSAFSDYHHALDAMTSCERLLWLGVSMKKNMDNFFHTYKADKALTASKHVANDLEIHLDKNSNGTFGLFGEGDTISIEEADDQVSKSLKQLRVIPGEKVITEGKRLAQANALILISKCKKLTEQLSNMDDLLVYFRKLVEEVEKSIEFDQDKVSNQRLLLLILRVSSRNFGIVIPRLAVKTVKQVASYIKASMKT